MDQIRIFDRNGYWLDQLKATVERAWMWTTETSAMFRISIYDAKCKAYTLNYGNLILVENSDGLPAWVGMIDGRGFEKGQAVIKAFSPERYFQYRRGPRRLRLQGSAGDIFAQMIHYINNLEQTVLAVGNIESESDEMTERLNPVPVMEDLVKLVKRSREGYRWRPEVKNGKLVIYGDWFTDMALDTGLILHDGWNVAVENPIEESAPANSVLTFGAGDDWGTRLIAETADDESAQMYGLRQVSINVQTDSLAMLERTASRTLEQVKQPSIKFPLQALNVGDTFERLAVGAQSKLVRLVGSGFSGDAIGHEDTQITVRGMYYNPENGYVELTL